MPAEKRELPKGWGVVTNPVDPVENEAVAFALDLETQYPLYANCMGDACILHMNVPRDKVRERAEEILRNRNWQVQYYPNQKDTHNQFGVYSGQFEISPTGKRRKEMGF
jgi:hypothetical protein